MNKDDIFNHDTKILVTGRFATSFGSSFTKFAIPLYLIQANNSYIHIGLQWTIVAIVQLIASIVTTRSFLFNSDKQGVIITEVLLGIFTLIPIFLSTSSSVEAAYLTTIATTFAVTIQSGHLTSIIGSTYLNSLDDARSRKILLSKLKNSENFSAVLGFIAAGVTVHQLGIKIAFIIDSITFFVGAFIFTKLKNKGSTQKENLSKGGNLFTLKSMFCKKLFYISSSQMFSILGVFIMNGIYIANLKEKFDITASQLSLLMISQLISTLLGSVVYSRSIHIIKEKLLCYLSAISRMTIAISLLLFSFHNSFHQFVSIYAIINFAIGFSLPHIMGMFQKNTHRIYLKNLGINRLLLNSISGSVGAAIGAYFLDSLGYQSLYAWASLSTFIGATLLFIHVKKGL